MCRRASCCCSLWRPSWCWLGRRHICESPELWGQFSWWTVDTVVPYEGTAVIYSRFVISKLNLSLLLNDCKWTEIHSEQHLSEFHSSVLMLVSRKLLKTTCKNGDKAAVWIEMFFLCCAIFRNHQQHINTPLGIYIDIYLINNLQLYLQLLTIANEFVNIM